MDKHSDRELLRRVSAMLRSGQSVSAEDRAAFDAAEARFNARAKPTAPKSLWDLPIAARCWNGDRADLARLDGAK